MLSLLIIAHLIGDLLLQNDWMQAKSRSHLHCLAHVALYATPFALLIALGLPVWAFAVIVVQHYAQDRWALHLRWSRLIGHTPPDRWPIGPFVVDQAWHLAVIGGVSLFLN